MFEDLDFGRNQGAGKARQQGRDVVDRGLFAVHHTETIGNECAILADQFGEGFRQRQSVRVVLAGLARIETDVLQQENVAVGQALGTRQCVGADHISGELDVPAELLSQHRSHRCQ